MSTRCAARSPRSHSGRSRAARGMSQLEADIRIAWSHPGDECVRLSEAVDLFRLLAARRDNVYAVVRRDATGALRTCTTRAGVLVAADLNDYAATRNLVNGVSHDGVALRRVRCWFEKDAGAKSRPTHNVPSHLFLVQLRVSRGAFIKRTRWCRIAPATGRRSPRRGGPGIPRRRGPLRLREAAVRMRSPPSRPGTPCWSGRRPPGR